MSRFGTKEILNYWAGTDQFLDYNFVPGVQTETMGRKEFYADFFCSSVYIWSEYLVNKLTKPSHYYHLGASPFVYADALVPRQKREGVCIFLPKWDVATGIDLEKVPPEVFRIIQQTTTDPVYAMAPADQRDDWYQFFTVHNIQNVKLISVFNDPGVEEWQLGVAVAMGRFKTFYFPLFSSATLYAYYSGANVRYYDLGDVYFKFKKQSQVDTYAELEDIHEKFQNLWIDNVDNKEIVASMVKLFLCPHKRQTPDELLGSLYMLNFYANRMTEKHGRHPDDWFYSNSTGRIIKEAVPLELYSKDKAMEKVEMKGKFYDKLEYHPAVAELIPEL